MKRAIRRMKIGVLQNWEIYLLWKTSYLNSFPVRKGRIETFSCHIFINGDQVRTSTERDVFRRRSENDWKLIKWCVYWRLPLTETLSLWSSLNVPVSLFPVWSCVPPSTRLSPNVLDSLPNYRGQNRTDHRPTPSRRV